MALLSAYRPSRVLAVTFTNKAARELRERLTKLVGPSYAEQITMGTFHSLCLAMLRVDIDKLPPELGYAYAAAAAAAAAVAATNTGTITTIAVTTATSTLATLHDNDAANHHQEVCYSCGHITATTSLRTMSHL